MLCEECHERDAVYTVAVVTEEGRVERHLCKECMTKMNADIMAGNIKALLSSILTAITGTSSAPEEQKSSEDQPVDDVTCERCGTTLAEFVKTGRLGCAGCYKAFHDQLQPMLLQIHGRVQHAGRRPLRNEGEQQVRSRRDKLTRLMAQAVAAEDFETAAQLRDQLRALSAAGEVQ